MERIMSRNHADYTAHSDRGSYGQIIPHESNYDLPDPERLRDIGILQQCFAKSSRIIRAKKAGGQKITPAVMSMYVIFRDTLRDINRTGRGSMSANKQRICMRYLGMTELPPLPPAGTPVGLQVLPAKPPKPRGRDADGNLLPIEEILH